VGIELHIGESKIAEQAMNRLILEGTEFEEELLVLTGKGNERWSRVSGKSERINNVCIKFMEVSRY
jgi:hypothetical protein